MGQPKPCHTILYRFVDDGPMHQHIAGIVFFQQFVVPQIQGDGNIITWGAARH